MIVSQYIYTACGKEKNGAFSVFSKSRDITNEESAEIREVMMYKTPSGLPYEPTERQIEELYPKKFGYFFLSSGRACLAQVCYVGRVYSDLDERFGNYIIHAFVFERTNKFAPYSFIEHTLFKRILIKKEWHDDPIPDELPKIEVPESGSMLSISELTTFIDEDRKNELKLLIEAIINSSNENAVYFNDDFNNHKFWFKILSVCLPKSIQNTVSFCTHFTNTLMPGNISSRIQMRVNQPENTLFSYAQEAQKGRFAFDFLRNIHPMSLKPGKYAISIVALLSSGIFEVVKFVDSINKIMTSFSVNINEASDLINLYREEYSNLKDTDELFNSILIADRVGYETQTIANNLKIKMSSFNFNAQQRLSIFAFIYKNISSIDTRIEIIGTIIDNAEQLGIRTSDTKTFRDELYSKANFIFANFIDYIKVEGIDNFITRNKNSFFKLFLTFDFLSNLPTVRNSFQTRNYNSSKEIIAVKDIMNVAMEKQSVPTLDLLINSANSRINGLGTELLSVIVQNTINTGISITNIQFAFSLLQRLRPKTDIAYNYLFYLIETIPDKDEFIKAYINAQNNDPAFFAKFEDMNKNKSFIVEFCRKKDVFRFVNQPLSQNTLKEYFDKYYVIGADTGLFIKRLEEYFYTLKSEERIEKCLTFLDLLKLPVNTDKTLLSPVYRVILEAIFSIQYDRIYNLCKKQEKFDKIIEIYRIITNAGMSLKQETRELVLITLCGKILEKYGSHGNNQVFLFLSKESQIDVNNLAAYFELINSDKNIDTFIDYYFQSVANILIVGATGTKQFNYEDLIEKVFGTIIKKGNLEKLTEKIIYGINKTNVKVIFFILYIFRKQLLSSPNAFDKKLGDIVKNIFEKLSTGDRKKIFSELLSLAEPNEVSQFERHFEEFNKEHKSGFFDIFKNKNK